MLEAVTSTLTEQCIVDHHVDKYVYQIVLLFAGCQARRGDDEASGTHRGFDPASHRRGGSCTACCRGEHGGCMRY